MLREGVSADFHKRMKLSMASTSAGASSASPITAPAPSSLAPTEPGLFRNVMEEDESVRARLHMDELKICHTLGLSAK